VTLTRADNQLELVVADDGRGFDVEAVRSAGGGLGLIAMDERVNAMSGELNISSTAGRGTSVRVRAAVEPVEPGTRN
jgi:signal transduction histidine kinase